MLKGLVNNAKIREKLIALNLAIVMLLSVFSFIAFAYVLNVYDSMLYESAFKYLEQSTSEIDVEISKMEAYSYNMLSDKDVQSSLYKVKTAGSAFEATQEAEKLLERFLIYTGAEQNISSIYFFDTTDYTYLGGINPTTIDEKNKMNIIKKAIQAEGNFVIYEGTAEYGYIVGARQMRRTTDLSLENLGVVAFKLELDDIVRNYLKNGEYEDSELIIVSPLGEILHESIGIDAYSVLREIERSDRGYSVINMEGKRYYAAYTSSEYSGWRYVSLIPYDEVFNRKEWLRRVIIVAFGVGVVLAILLSFGAAANITKPIQALTKRMKKVEKGDFKMDETPFEYEARQDEVGQLHRDFEIMIRHIDALIEENYKKQIIIKDTSLKALQSQINPHFLYNTLQSINWLAKVKKETEISIMAESLGKLMRNAIDTQHMMITIGQELQLLDAYINIQKYRFEERLLFTNHIGSRFKNYKIPKLTFQPVVENAIKHGLENMLEPCHINIEAYEDGEHLVVKVSDNGPGMEERMVTAINNHQSYVSETGLGIGVSNIDQRLKMVFGEAYGLSVESQMGEGTVVSIRMPMVRDDDYV